MSFEGGFTSALNSGSNRDMQSAQTDQIRQHMALLAQQQQQEQMQRMQDQQLGMGAIKAFAKMQMDTPPPIQAPPPGQASVPMQPSQTNPPPQMPPMGAMGMPPSPMQQMPQNGAPPPMQQMPQQGGGAPMMRAGPPGDGMPAMAPPPPQIPPPSPWQASPSAPPSLGGPGGASAPQMPPGGAPGAIPPPPTGAAPGGAPGAPGMPMPGMMPAQLMSVPSAIQALDKAGIPPEQQYKVLQKMMPMIDAENRKALADLGMQVKISNALNKTLHEQLNIYRQQNPQDTAAMRNAKFAAGSPDDPAAKLVAKTFDSKKKPGAAGGSTPPVTAQSAGLDAMTYDYLLRGHNPPAKSGAYERTMANVEKLAKENGMTTQELISASADVKTKLMAKRSFEIRTQNIGRAENQLMQEIPVMEDAMKSLDLPSLPIAARGKIAVLRQMGDPNITKLDQAAHTVFNEFHGIITGNPGTLNVQDVQNAEKEYKAAQTPQQMKAAVDGMRRIIANAKKANDISREEIMGGINDSISGKNKKGAAPSGAPQAGKVENGYRFKGGDPAKKENWEKV